ncbi:hypothetical protein N7462_005663 [Penicillium macrosclerotiorum]|uniref:uncharacterized protein n=1 Tax=Penicillium macrosclerotiorum TaxID=303699 RepID=UPI002547B9E9|nr:uncharacterized protein N7462_005663 [Penicillium macrosclerotiorum]KAJ5682498.1 hypothetical protein N7462_005663 [Penicillium macrosclerotiorum]
MASIGALPQTLKSITATKITELSKQRALFDKKKAEILEATSATQDLRNQALILLNGLSRLKGYPKDAIDKDDMDLDVESDDNEEVDVTLPGMGQLYQADHTNIRRFLLQGRYDASISTSTLKGWIASLENELRFLELKHEHATFYSKLVTEWLSHLDNEAANSDAGFESLGRAEMHEQRAKWESLVFISPTHVDEKAIRDYLDGLFRRSKLSRQSLKELRAKIHKFGNDMATKGEWLNVEKLQLVSKSLLKTDLLSADKTTVLKEFLRNTEVSQEVADVLNMRLASLDTWSWSGDGIPVEMRRQLNGKYRVFMDEDLLDSLLLQYLGTEWAVKLRELLMDFYNSHAWSPLSENIPEEDVKRRKFFLESGLMNSRNGSINLLREQTYKEKYFMSQLPASAKEGTRSYDDDAQEKNALDIKHSLLHLLITESLIYNRYRGEFTAIRSDYQWFGPSLPHATVLTVLEYFNVPEMWLKFFKTFLEAPLKFFQDGPDAVVQVRRCGVPMSHTLSDVFGEAVLFCMDYAVNQTTDGGILYRLHDDFWFWGTQKTCEEAWRGMTEYAKVMGLEFNQEKTGTVQMGRSGIERNPNFPVGDIRWGFLVLDAEQGRFVIDQKQVDQHIDELNIQLSSCKSVFAWVQAWNSYFGRFFPNNFAKPAMCFGRDHIDMAISTLSRIERSLFSKLSDRTSNIQGGVTEYLRTIIAERFDINGLPEGFFYYPVDLGGLGLLNPFIQLLAMRENIKQTPRKFLEKPELADEKRYLVMKERFEKQGPTSSKTWMDDNDKPLPFMSLEEFTKYPESYNSELREAYTSLTSVPEEKSISSTAGFTKSQRGLKGSRDGAAKSGPISANWADMTPYWRWIGELYHDEIVRKYGSLAAVNREFMPLGVLKTLKEDRLRWQG